jgi:3-phosphoshikimate 1-carboxyvinyltransferase
MNPIKINYHKFKSIELYRKRPIDGEIYLEGSKSITNRILILAAQSKTSVKIYNYSPSDDSQMLISALRKIGVNFDFKDKYITVTPPKTFNPYKGEINVGPAGTCMRFLTSFLATIPGLEVQLSGSTRMHERPISDLVEALILAGADIEYLGKKGCPPLLIRGKEIHNTNLEVSGKISSQYITSILLSAPSFKNKLKLKIKDKLVSKSYVDLTLAILEDIGVYVNRPSANIIEIENTELNFENYLVEGDASGASYFWSLAALSNARIRVYNISRKSKQGDIAYLDVLEEMGCLISDSDNSVEVSCLNGNLKGIKTDFSNLPDCAQTLAVLASTLGEKTEIAGLSTLKNKETDRLLALKKELIKLNVETEISSDKIIIYPNKMDFNLNITIDTYDDHRMAMSFAILVAKLRSLKINEPFVVSKSFPSFWEKLEQVGVGINLLPKNRIILTGFMGAGKSSIAKLLAQKLKLPLIDLDLEILNITKANSINEIFEKLGENEFRNLETLALTATLNKDSFILATGGGILTREENRELLKNDDICNIYLSASWDVILNRLNDVSNRPLFKDASKAKKLYEQRLAIYENEASLTLNTDDYSIEDLAMELEGYFNLGEK